MGAKFTPGPWTIEETDAEDQNEWIVGTDGESIVMVSHDIMDDEEVLANARLIAAAPDLAAVAKRYEAWEARLILCDEAWSGGVAPLPTLTEELWDELLEIQRDRNEAIGKAGLRDGGKGGAA
jgi:hypothetical protein